MFLTAWWRTLGQGSMVFIPYEVLGTEAVTPMSSPSPGAWHSRALSVVEPQHTCVVHGVEGPPWFVR